MVEVVFENFVNYLRSGNTDKLNIISFQQNQQHKINLSTQLIFYRILTKTVVQLTIVFSCIFSLAHVPSLQFSRVTPSPSDPALPCSHTLVELAVPFFRQLDGLSNLTQSRWCLL
ncbi:Hypothetical_protein [Hexamita inflata]|uniref:Hypothetical_protein n=1 Tax=Hexamita inflata TaxID=28002 RepID=A0AA86NAJ6_9EUKA|nr:Hypothetical protein HINF_LOCUS3386 [Hexamita inflata]